VIRRSSRWTVYRPAELLPAGVAGVLAQVEHDLVAANNTLTLPNYVGQRVAATGTLENREMRVRSRRRVASSCY
jgi:hypothetical protein